MSETNALHHYFGQLGFEPEIADIYSALDLYGPQSVLQLARNAKIERTRLYRLLDKLTENQLVEVEVAYKRKIYKAAPLSNLQVVLAKKEQEVHELQQGLAELQVAYTTQAHQSPTTHVQFYRGADGVKQMFWNQTKSHSENLSVLYENMQSRTNAAFFARWVERCNQEGLRSRSVVSDHFLQSQKKWYATQTNQKLTNWQGRYIPAKFFPITHSMVTYDNVVAYFNWKDGEIFGVEVYNQEIATTQRHYFEMLWTQATSIPTTS